MLVEKWTKDNRVLEIHVDEDPRNPRKEFDNLGVMVCQAENLGDKRTWKTLEALYHTVLVPDGGPWLRVYLAVHDGLTLRTVPFEYIRNEGHVGYIYVPTQDMERDGLTREQALDGLQHEVVEYNHYLGGQVFGYNIYTLVPCPECGHEERKDKDSCWGFYGSDHKESGLLEMAGLESLEGWTNAKV